MKRSIRFLRTMQWLAVLAMSLLSPLADAAQAAGRTTAPRTLIVTGSSTVYPLMIDIARRFESLNPGATIEIGSVGSGRGVADLRAERIDIAMISRPQGEDERDLFAFPLSRDAVAIVVHRSSPLKGLDARQLTDILTGNVKDWRQLGGRPGPVKVIWRTEGQAIPELLLQHLKLKPEQIRKHATFFENTDAVKFAANDRNAISFAALGVAERAAKTGTPIKLLAFDGVAASRSTLRDHTYALSRPLILLTRAVPTGLQKQFVDYAVSAAVVDLQEKHGFVAYNE